MSQNYIAINECTIIRILHLNFRVLVVDNSFTAYYVYYKRFFYFVFKDSSQIELLKELLDLLQDMVVMLLSLLEGISMLYCT